MDDAVTAKAIQYLEKHCKMVKTSGKGDISVTYPISSRYCNLADSETGKQYCIVDSGADTGLKGSTSIFIEHTCRRANVNGFDSEGNHETNLPIGTCVTATKDKYGETVNLLEDEQIDFSRQDNSMMSFNQMRHFGG